VPSRSPIILKISQVVRAFVGISTVVVARCGGVVENGNGGSDGGTGDGSPGSDGNPGTEGGNTCVGPCALDAGPSGCPGTPPPAGTICITNNLVCEYGSAPNPHCNDLWQCLGRDPPFTWRNVTMTSTGICSPPGTVCPSSYAAAMGTSGNCMNERICEYPEGTCLCTRSPGGNPVMNGPVWSCIPLSTGCTSPRPQLGSPCTDPGPLCDYGACSGGVDIQCVGGYWAIAMVGCRH
jgi:hypothetical protein